MLPGRAVAHGHRHASQAAEAGDHVGPGPEVHGVEVPPGEPFDGLPFPLDEAKRSGVQVGEGPAGSVGAPVGAVAFEDGDAAGGARGGPGLRPSQEAEGPGRRPGAGGPVGEQVGAGDGLAGEHHAEEPLVIDGGPGQREGEGLLARRHRLREDLGVEGRLGVGEAPGGDRLVGEGKVLARHRPAVLPHCLGPDVVGDAHGAVGPDHHSAVGGGGHLDHEVGHEVEGDGVHLPGAGQVGLAERSHEPFGPRAEGEGGRSRDHHGEGDAAAHRDGFRQRGRGRAGPHRPGGGGAGGGGGCRGGGRSGRRGHGPGRAAVAAGRQANRNAIKATRRRIPPG